MMFWVLVLGLVAFLWAGAAATGYGAAKSNEKGLRRAFLVSCYVLAIAGFVVAAGMALAWVIPEVMLED